MKKIINKLALMLFIPFLLYGQFEWNTIGEMPRPVAGAASFTADNNIFVFGGYSDSTQNYTDWIQKYRDQLSLWKNIDNMNFVRYGLSASQANDTVYYFGGIQLFDDSTTSLEKWSSNTPAEIIDSDSIFNRTFGSSQIIGNKLYLIGGNPFTGSTEQTPLIAEYNLTTRSVEYKLDSLFSVGYNPEQMMTAVIGRNIYIFGGALIGVSKEIYRYNIDIQTLTKLGTELNTPRAGGVAIVNPLNESEIYIIGGYNESNSALASTEIFRVISQTEEMIVDGPPLLYPRMLHTAQNLNDEILVMGGYDENGTLVNQIEALSFSAVSVKDISVIPKTTKLLQNFPNPFNPSTTIKYSVAQASVRNGHNPAHIKLIIYNSLGEQISELVNDYQAPGNYQVNFDGKNFSSGVYFYRLFVGNLSESKKMILTK